MKQKRKKALVLGVTGQDGSFMARLLLKKKYIVHGFIRKSATGNTKNILDIINKEKNFIIHHGDLLDFSSVTNAISNIKPDDKVLHIGGLTGYVTSLLCKLSNNVIVIENDEQLMIELKNNLKKNNLVNVETINRDLELGYEEKSPYDIILIDCPLKHLPNLVLNQLNPDYGKLLMIDKINNDLGKGIKITNINNNFNKEILFDTFSKFTLYTKKEEFIF